MNIGTLLETIGQPEAASFDRKSPASIGRGGGERKKEKGKKKKIGVMKKRRLLLVLLLQLLVVSCDETDWNFSDYSPQRFADGDGEIGNEYDGAIPSPIHRKDEEIGRAQADGHVRGDTNGKTTMKRRGIQLWVVILVTIGGFALGVVMGACFVTCSLKRAEKDNEYLAFLSTSDGTIPQP
jgi:hypothetical protein